MCADPQDYALKKQEFELKQQEFDLKKKEYNLKLDEESSKYLESKQKLTYFLISSAVAVIGLLLDFTFKNQASISIHLGFVVVPVVAGVISAGASLLSLHFLHMSFRLHLTYLHEGKNWDQLSIDQQKEWDSSNMSAGNAHISAFIFLFLEVFFSALFLIWTFFISKP